MGFLIFRYPRVDIFYAQFAEINDARKQAITDWNALEAMNKAKPVAYTLNAVINCGCKMVIKKRRLKFRQFHNFVK
jgi:hypothetical protein